MPKSNKPLIVFPEKQIVNHIYLIRGKKVMIDQDLAKLYGVTTKRLNEQVKRNHKRFPDDFMFQLKEEEMGILRSQFATSRLGHGGRRYFAHAFTELGVAMLSSVLNSERAIEVNMQIMRSFSKLREMLTTHKDLKRKIEGMEKKYDRRFRVVFKAMTKLLTDEKKPKKQIGFKTKP